MAGDQAFVFMTSVTATADVDAEFEIALTGVMPTSITTADFLL